VITVAKKALTERRQHILDFIDEHIDEHGYPPTVREIGGRVGLSSSSSVHFHLKALEDAGYLERDATLTRAIRKTGSTATASSSGSRPIPLVGRVAAGEPILATENVDELIPMPDAMLPDGEVFMLEVKGDSMQQAGILDGDYVVVQCRENADNGDIVVALLEDEATVKRFYKHPDHIELRPENDRYEPIIVNNVQIIGRVRGVLRHYR